MPDKAFPPVFCNFSPSSMAPRIRDITLHHLQLWMNSAANVVRLITVFCWLYSNSWYWAQPYHTSKLTGQQWVEELMRGHPGRIYNELGVHLHVFVMLLIELQGLGYSDSKYVSLEEQLAIFLYTCRTGLGCHHVDERFQRSNETIKKWVDSIFTMQGNSTTMQILS
jgi:hypothetical protein